MMFRQITLLIAGLAAAFGAMLGAALVTAAPAMSMEMHDVVGQYGWKTTDAVYDPASKSYYQLRVWTELGGMPWDKANQYASEQSFKGVQGRLAVVEDYDTHLFLLKTFRIRYPTWIGMKVNCKPIRAFWLDGKAVDELDFNAWDMKQWYRDQKVTCMNGSEWMGVYYTSTSDLFRWQASGQHKSFDFLFIQYPTGKP